MRRVPSCLLASLIALVTTIAAPASAGPRGVDDVASPRRAIPDPTPCAGCWTPGPRTSWQWQLNAPPRPARLLDVEMYDVDGFETSRRLVRRMHSRGIRAVCYVSA